ncbi:MAG: hypothetical protein WC517_00435 [Patescibacteria group bacterium]
MFEQIVVRFQILNGNAGLDARFLFPLAHFLEVFVAPIVRQRNFLAVFFHLRGQPVFP